jgi:sialidase-1
MMCMSQAAAPTSLRLFHSGQEGYPRYRIPSLLMTAKGSVLAICEGRKDGRGLTGNIDIVIKRSVDNGRTWNPLAVVADDGEHTLGNPCAVVDRRDGRIWLLLTRSHGKDVEDDIVAGTQS